MDWTAKVDNYCERVDFSFWSEPLNAVTNAAFLIGALVALLVQRRYPPHGAAILLTVILTAIGIGSFLFHTLATRWASLADTAPILAFILVYIYAANRQFLVLGIGLSLGLTALFFPYAIAVSWALNQLVPLGASAAYASVALLIFLYAGMLASARPDTARGLALGAGVLCVSITARTLDGPLCGSIPFGTHFLWHILNGTMLTWMIVLLLQDRLREGIVP